MKIFLTTALRIVLTWLAGFKWKDFLRVVLFVKDAATAFKKSPDLTPAEELDVNAKRREAVGRMVDNAFPGLVESDRNGLIEMAVAWVKKGKGA